MSNKEIKDLKDLSQREREEKYINDVYIIGTVTSINLVKTGRSVATSTIVSLNLTSKAETVQKELEVLWRDPKVSEYYGKQVKITASFWYNGTFMGKSISPISDIKVNNFALPIQVLDGFEANLQGRLVKFNIIGENNRFAVMSIRNRNIFVNDVTSFNRISDIINRYRTGALVTVKLKLSFYRNKKTDEVRFNYLVENVKVDEDASIKKEVTMTKTVISSDDEKEVNSVTKNLANMAKEEKEELEKESEDIVSEDSENTEPVKEEEKTEEVAEEVASEPEATEEENTESSNSDEIVDFKPPLI